MTRSRTQGGYGSSRAPTSIQELDDGRQYVREELDARLRDINLAIGRISNIARLVFPERRIGAFDLFESSKSSSSQTGRPARSPASYISVTAGIPYV